MLSWIDAHFTSLLNGVAIGSLLFIVAVGMSLIFGMMDVLNLAHGVLFLAGAYAAWWIVGEAPSWPRFAAALAVAGAAGALAGVGLSLLVGRLARRSHLDQALLTLGLALIGADLLSIAFGDDVHSIKAPPGLDGSTAVLGKIYPVYRLVLIGLGAALAAVVHVVVERTSLGALVRATVADRHMVAAIGVDERKVKLVVFAVGAVLATTAGVLGMPVLGVGPGLDSTELILALVVVVIGGLGSVRGALFGALVIGEIWSLGRDVLADVAPFVQFGALALVLVLRPRGLFGAATGARS
ncbi:MAG: branched-chain amino acid ABC transporter permease [Deltaproteobacteria bacterium]|nr:MAG: branched-chain amino acid ABC transporter permease [Deltaproteobacteria bacterium]